MKSKRAFRVILCDMPCFNLGEFNEDGSIDVQKSNQWRRRVEISAKNIKFVFEKNVLLVEDAVFEVYFKDSSHGINRSTARKCGKIELSLLKYKTIFMKSFIKKEIEEGRHLIRTCEIIWQRLLAGDRFEVIERRHF